MKYINKFNTTEDYNQAIGGGELSQLKHYLTLTEDNQMVHLKPLPLPNILVITTNNTGTTIYKRTDSGYEEVTLENGENTFTDWNYGFYFNGSMKQSQITSFDLSKYDTSNVTNMFRMFINCSGLTSLDLSSFNTSNVTSMQSMFFNCNSLTSLDLSSFDTSNVTNMTQMFQQCSGLTSLDLSNFNTSNVTIMIQMFYNCSNLTSLNVSSFDTSKVTNMSNMFIGCDKLTHIKCKQSFKDWCWTSQDTINLPTSMRDGGSGTWEIVQ